MGQSSSTETTLSQPTPPTFVKPPNHPKTSSASPSECPVDHKSREAWMKAAQRQSAAQDISSPASNAPVRPRLSNSRLSTHREISTIPRGFDASPAPTPPSPSPSGASHGAATYSAPDNQAVTPNAQTADPHTSSSGTWIYPSEEMFFNAMKRKAYNPQAKDMSNIIPIHNAVNEKTWQEILRWERPYNDSLDGDKSTAGVGLRSRGGLCNGPKLVSFAGDSSKLTPRARWNTFLGYEKPFDRHDWVVDRCGTKVEYVIDYYQGKQKQGQAAPGPSFYLDVRPKLNSWEGVRMRVARAFGMEES